MTALAAAFALSGLGLAALVGTRRDEVTSPRDHAPAAPSTTVAADPGSTVPPEATTVPSPSEPAPEEPSTGGPPMATPPRPTVTTVPEPHVSPAVVVRRGPAERRVVALTFDAGSDTGHAAAILDRLRSEGVPATIGMTGRWAEANPGLVRRMIAEGHQLVNHSYDHPSFTGRSTGAPPLSRDARLGQLARAEAAIRAAAGVGTVPWFRPPYGDEDASVRHDVALAGYRYELMWTVDSLGWKGVEPGAVAQRCLDGAVPGAIYLFHLGSASTDHAALGEIIAGLRQQGYGFVTAARLVSP